MTLAEELDGLMDGAYPEPQDEETRQAFRLTDDGMAEWAMRKIVRARRALDEANDVADAQVAKIDEWLSRKKRDLAQAEEFFGNLLRGYYLPQHEEDPKRRKTFRLPSGQVQFRAQQPEFVRDDIMLLKWLKKTKRRAYIEKIERPKWGELKKALTPHGDYMIDEHGEVVAGIQVIERPTAIRIVTATEAEGEA